MPSNMRLVIEIANPRPSTVLVVAGASPPVGLTPLLVGLTPMSVWQVGPAPSYHVILEVQIMNFLHMQVAAGPPNLCHPHKPARNT